MAEPCVLSESLGDYLETIFHLVSKTKFARVKDIAFRMQVQMPSVTGAIKSLVDRGLVEHDPYGLVNLTPKGNTVAQDLVKRHMVLSEFLEKILGIAPKVADRNACHLEHNIEPEVLDQLINFLEFIDACPRTDDAWSGWPKQACSNGSARGTCRDCLSRTLTALSEEGKDRRNGED